MGARIMVNVYRNELPLAVITHAANHYEMTLAQKRFDFFTIEFKPDHLTGDRAYNSYRPADKLHRKGIEVSPRMDWGVPYPGHNMVIACTVINGAGWRNAYLPGFSGKPSSGALG